MARHGSVSGVISCPSEAIPCLENTHSATAVTGTFGLDQGQGYCASEEATSTAAVGTCLSGLVAAAAGSGLIWARAGRCSCKRGGLGLGMNAKLESTFSRSCSASFGLMPLSLFAIVDQGVVSVS